MDRRSWLPEDLRAHHRGMLLRLLGEEGPLTRRELAQRSGLSIPTAASIVTALLAGGQITESAPWAGQDTPRGPRAGLLSLARHAHLALGVELCANRLRIGLGDLGGVVSEVASAAVPHGGEPARVLDLAVDLARPAVAAAGDRLVGIGVAVPGPVDDEGRRSVLSLPLGWRDVPVAERFEDAFRVPAVAEYNVRAMAVAESRYGLGLRAENLLYIHLDEGFGVAFVVDGLAFRQGAHGVSEIGHHRFVDAGPRCACGAAGCLDAILGRTHLLQRVRDAARDSPGLAPLVARRLPVLELLDIATHVGETRAERILDEVVTHLSTAIALSVDMFSPTRVALGGELATAPKDLLHRVEAASRDKISLVLRDQVRIERSEIGRYPAVLGAATVALDRLFYRDQAPLPATRGSRRPRPAWVAAASSAPSPDPWINRP